MAIHHRHAQRGQLRGGAPHGAVAHRDRPSYYQGFIEACVALAGGQRVRTRVVSREGQGARLHVEWEESRAGV
ncbi:DUF2378 family protein [Vitiosangium sp. GDMCC 1.1324]|uniref:DUF2378 family protein n=1 Tax=Vitiosangium sp. (strain GDMCC 1.1324) TaxID=2138576 RepID=UPI000D3C0A03|nr:DUF2378 family protein [Vitiosangium sp. GDMCC 1.1324]PTL85063.1 hypothetical protein DAT35_08475 [Vitiosangium sp. GDMCC 1.1324]